jgi:hypothetical protein
MYEIWLMLNIVYEIALSAWPLLAAALGIWLVLLWGAGGRLDRRAWPTALLAGVAVAALAFLALPTLTRSSLGDMGYWMDWAALAGLALAAGAAASLLAFPLVSLLKRPG